MAMAEEMQGLFDVVSPNQRVANCVAVLRQIPGWQARPGHDEQLVSELMKRYPEVDLLGELRRCRDWCVAKNTDHTARGGEQRVRNWLRRGRSFQLDARRAAADSARAAAGEARLGARPSSRSEFEAERRGGCSPW